MTNFYLRPNGKWWPSNPPPSGGPIPFIPGDDWKPTRKKTTEDKILCMDGPLHNVKIKMQFKIGHGGKRKVSLLDPNKGFPDTGTQLPAINQQFTVKPYQGFYQYDPDQNVYYWSDNQDD